MSSPLSTFIAELKRRRVFRVAVVYGGVAFVLVQIIDGTFEVMGIPGWVSRLTIILLALGFPLAVGLAWVFDITPEGIVRSAGRSTGKPGTSNRALIVIAVLAVAFGVWSRWGGSAKDGPLTLAVLPFQNYSEEGGDWFADGFTDELISQLSKLSNIMVMSRTTTMHYKKTALSAGDIGAELGADLVLEGSILRAEGKVRITGQLIDTETEGHIWSESYQRPLEDVIALQADVAFSIAQALKEELTPAEARDLVALPTGNPVAYDHYLRALSIIDDLDLHPLSNRDSSVARKDQAIDELERALVLDPAFTKAHYQVVKAHGRLYTRKSGQDPSAERLAKMDRALARAENVAPGTLPVKLARGIAHLLGRREYRQALEVFEPLYKQHPGDTEIMRLLGLTYRRVGRWDEALELLVQAADLNPRDAQATLAVLQTYRLLHRYEEAQRYFERLKYLGATDRYVTRAWIAVEGYGDLDEAWTILQEGVQELGPNALIRQRTFMAMYRDDFDSAWELYEIRTASTGRESLFWKSVILLFEGEMEQAAVAHRSRMSEVLNDTAVTKNGNYYGWLAINAAVAGEGELVAAWADSAITVMNPDIDAMRGTNILGLAAWAFLLNGDLERGLDLLEEMQAVPNNHTIYDLLYTNVYDIVRDHPRFIALMERLKGGR